MIDEFIAAALGRLQNRHVPFLSASSDPVAELIGDAGQQAARHPLSVSIRIEKADHPFRLLKGLDQSIEQEPVEAPVAEADATL